VTGHHKLHTTPSDDDAINVPNDLIDFYWHHTAPRERAHAAVRAVGALDNTAGEFRCAACTSTRVHRDVIGDLVCAECQARWRPPTTADSPTCPACGSGKVNKTGYGDWVCRDCSRQWRPD
jgi:ribosomal protein L37AE/L43A